MSRKIATVVIIWTLLGTLLVLPFLVSCSNQGSTSTAPVSGSSSTPAKTAISTSAPSPQQGGIIKIVSPAVPVIGYPPEMGIAAASIAGSPSVESLLAQNADGATLPKLATAWQISPDGTSITLTLRKGVKFIDGTDFNAQAVKWNLGLEMAGKTSGTKAWTSIDVVDDYTIRITLSQWDNTVLSYLARQCGFMVSPAAFQKNGIDWSRVNPVGTGPFKLKSFERDVSAIYERNANYWGDKPYLDGVQFLFIKDPNAQEAALRTGEVDALRDANLKSAAQLQKEGFNIIYKSSFTYVLTPDSGNSDSPFANSKVRGALDYAIDKAGIAKALGYGFEFPASQVSPPDYMAYVSSLADRVYDQAKAKQLLSEAGYPNGFKTTLFVRSDQDQEAMTAVQAQLSGVGITAQIQVVDNATFTQYSQKGWKNGLVLTPWGLDSVFGTVLLMRFGPTYMVSQLRPQELTSILNDMTLSKDNDSTKALCQKAVGYIYNNSLVTPLFFSGSNVVVKPSIHDTGFLTSGGITDWTPAKAWKGK